MVHWQNKVHRYQNYFIGESNKTISGKCSGCSPSLAGEEYDFVPFSSGRSIG
jgi:hypothetical protein